MDVNFSQNPIVPMRKSLGKWHVGDAIFLEKEGMKKHAWGRGSTLWVRVECFVPLLTISAAARGVHSPASAERLTFIQGRLGHN